MSALRDVIAAAIWRRVTEDEDNDVRWDDLWPADREEFEQDADAVLEDLAEEGYVVVQSAGKLADALDVVGGKAWPPPPAARPTDTTAAAVDALAREVVHRMVLADASVQWEDYPQLGENDWAAVVKRVLERAEADKPDRKALLDAYEYLTARAEATT